MGGGGYKVRCKTQTCASNFAGAKTPNSYADPALKAAMDPCDPSNVDAPACGVNGWCVGDEWGEASCACDTGKFFVQDKTITARVTGVCVTKENFDTFIENKYVVANEVVQHVKVAGVAGLQLNDAEMVLEQATKKALNIAPENIAVRYKDHHHEERHDSPAKHAQKLYLSDRPSRFVIQVRCQQSNRQCDLAQLELLAALNDRKNSFNEALRKAAGKETAYVAASGVPHVTSLTGLNGLHEEMEGGFSAANGFLGVVAGVALVTLGLVTFFQLRKHRMIPCTTPANFSRMSADQQQQEEPLNSVVPDVE